MSHLVNKSYLTNWLC